MKILISLFAISLVVVEVLALPMPITIVCKKGDDQKEFHVTMETSQMKENYFIQYCKDNAPGYSFTKMIFRAQQCLPGDKRCGVQP
ncbi:hypothetical protein A3F06_00315 [candidate division TM6 bacterium RIFCSPHIGHO2_12_FULL_36_22]|nr:MAG: hypothetical protein A3F06_00315 [candidate division TM6 bacterium RIFCSPHIGHO2_12_FULL_36_22]